MESFVFRRLTTSLILAWVLPSIRSSMYTKLSIPSSTSQQVKLTSFRMQSTLLIFLMLLAVKTRHSVLFGRSRYLHIALRFVNALFPSRPPDIVSQPSWLMSLPVLTVLVIRSCFRSYLKRLTPSNADFLSTLFQ